MAARASTQRARPDDVDDLVRDAVGQLRGVVLIGADRARLAEALARHAPDVPVVEVPSTDTGVMETVVARAAELAQPGDVVPIDLTVRARPALAVWPLFAVVPVLLGASLGRDPEVDDLEPVDEADGPVDRTADRPSDRTAAPSVDPQETP